MLSSAAHTLLSALLTDLPGSRHLLSLHTRHTMSTAVLLQGEGFAVEHPPVVERLCAVIANGATAGVVLRSFTDQVSHTLPNGVDIPVKLVRGWSIADRGLTPLDEAQMFDAYCTDAASGEPVPPERGVVYTDAPAVDLTAFHDT